MEDVFANVESEISFLVDWCNALHTHHGFSLPDIPLPVSNEDIQEEMDACYEGSDETGVVAHADGCMKAVRDRWDGIAKRLMDQMSDDALLAYVASLEGAQTGDQLAEAYERFIYALRPHLRNPSA